MRDLCVRVPVFIQHPNTTYNPHCVRSAGLNTTKFQLQRYRYSPPHALNTYAAAHVFYNLSFACWRRLDSMWLTAFIVPSRPQVVASSAAFHG